MDRDDIIKLAREAGICIANSILLPAPKGQVEALERFAALVAEHMKKDGWRQCAVGQGTTQFCGMAEQAVLAEREACARTVERLISGDGVCADDGVWIHDCAAAIRSRT